LLNELFSLLNLLIGIILGIYVFRFHFIGMFIYIFFDPI